MINRIWRRLHNIVAFGTTQAAVNDSGANAVVQTQLSAIETHPAMRIVQQFGFSSSMPVGAKVVSIFNGGDRSNGVILGTVDPATRRTGLVPGEVAVGPSVTIEIHFATGQVTVKHPTKVRFETPRLECTGEVVAQCDGPYVTLSQHTHPANSTPPTPHT